MNPERGQHGKMHLKGVSVHAENAQYLVSKIELLTTPARTGDNQIHVRECVLLKWTQCDRESEHT